MKKLLILILIIPFFSCETNTIEIEKTAGEWYRGGWKGKGYRLNRNECALRASPAPFVHDSQSQH